MLDKINKLALATVLFSFTNVSCADVECPDCAAQEVVDEQDKPSSEPLDEGLVSYLNSMNLDLEKQQVPFRYVTHKVGNHKFATEPFNLTNEKRFQKNNTNYDVKFDNRFKEMIRAFDSSVDLSNKELYAEGTQTKGLYIQDIKTKKNYVLYEICYDPKCSVGKAFFTLDPQNYDISGVNFDGCKFTKRYSNIKNSRLSSLMEQYINTQDPADHSYSYNACKGN